MARSLLWLLVAVLCALPSAVLGCHSDDPPAPASGDDADTVTLAPNTHVLDDSLVQDADVQADRIVFPAAGHDDILKLQPGDIIVSGYGRGFLRGVVNVVPGSAGAGQSAGGPRLQTPGDSIITVFTRLASLLEAVTDLKVKYRAFSFSNPTVQVGVGWFGADLGGVTTGHFSIAIEHGVLGDFALDWDTQQQLNLQFKESGSASIFSKPLGAVDIQVGLLPIVLAFWFDLRVGVDDGFIGNVQCKLDHHGASEWTPDRGWWRDEGQMTPGCTGPKDFSLKAGASIQVSVNAQLDALLYDVAGAALIGQLGFELQAFASNTNGGSIDTCLYLNAEADIGEATNPTIQDLAAAGYPIVDAWLEALQSWKAKLWGPLQILVSGSPNCNPTPDAGAPPDGGAGDASPDSPSDGAVCSQGLTACGSVCTNLAADPQNCLACGNDCKGGVCTVGGCTKPGSYALATGQAEPAGIATDGTNVYWTNNSTGEVNECSNVTCAGQGVWPFSSGNSGPQGIVTDGSNVYWANYMATQLSVFVAPACPPGKTCGTQSAIGEFQNGAYGVTVAGNNVIWTNLDGGTLKTCAASGCNNSPTLVAQNMAGPKGIVNDGTHVYWTNTGTSANAHNDGSVMFCKMGNYGPTGCLWNKLFPGNIYFPNFLAIDVAGHTLYFTTQDGYVWSCDTAGCSGAHAFATASTTPDGIATDGKYVYWVERGTMANNFTDGAVKKCPVGPPCNGNTLLVASAQRPHQIAFDDYYVYWTNPGDGTVRKAPK